MALVKFGAGVSEMRGKEGGVIYSRNAYGSYIKAKVSPVNPQSIRQQEERSLMGTLSQLWSTLSSAKVDSWDNLGAQVTRVNRFGDSTNYTGFSLFMRLNRNLNMCGLSAITDAPVPPTLPEFVLGALQVNATTPAISIAFTPTIPSGMYLAIYMTNNIVTGRKFVKNYYRFIITKLEQTSPYTTGLLVAWNAVFPNVLVEGAKIYFKCKVIDGATGFDTVPAVGVQTVVTS